jgi:hypothetical protein
MIYLKGWESCTKFLDAGGKIAERQKWQAARKFVHKFIVIDIIIISYHL